VEENFLSLAQNNGNNERKKDIRLEALTLQTGSNQDLCEVKTMLL
jgi:hypothetical protein